MKVTVVKKVNDETQYKEIDSADIRYYSFQGWKVSEAPEEQQKIAVKKGKRRFGSETEE